MLGKTLSHCRVLDLLAVGGMGEVYRAEDTMLGRMVALKVLPEGFTADAERLARFEREARALAAIDHPSIAAIYSFQEAVVGPPFADPEDGEGEGLADLSFAKILFRVRKRRTPAVQVEVSASRTAQSPPLQ